MDRAGLVKTGGKRVEAEEAFKPCAYAQGLNRKRATKVAAANQNLNTLCNPKNIALSAVCFL